MKIKESELKFNCHLTEFVYRMNYKDKNYIKKETSDSYDVYEFLYEVNTLNALNSFNQII